MSGYIHDPLQIINLIADNIRDRYRTGFSVIKEIIQNADDAGGYVEDNYDNKLISLEFGISPGIPSSDHPLLKGPGLFFFNDGNFTQSDAVAVKSFGLNSKAIDEATIGKFGLGMKSVFHFCEAFFFLARDLSRTYEEILNPWSGSAEFKSLHVEWDEFSRNDSEALLEHLSNIIIPHLNTKETWFLLWLPLRSAKHILNDGKEVGSIVAEFPGDNLSRLGFLKKPQMPLQLANLLPLLRKIACIQFWEINHETNNFESIYRISMESPQSRTHFPFMSKETFLARL